MALQAEIEAAIYGALRSLDGADGEPDFMIFGSDCDDPASAGAELYKRLTGKDVGNG